MHTLLAAVVLSAAAILCVSSSSAPTARLVASFPLKEASFASIASPVPNSHFPGNSKAVVITSFGFLGSDPIYGVPNVSSVFHGEAPTVVQLDSTIAWPNQAQQVPQGQPGLTRFQGASVLLEAGGFFPNPAKSTGAVALGIFSSQTSKNIKISTDKKGYFYHHAVWYDMDGDGLDDVVAARCYVSSVGGKDFGELLWLKQPAGNPFVSDWEEHVLVTPNGPDVYFALADLDNDNKMEIISTQFFDAGELAVYSCSQAHWSECSEGTSTPVSVLVVDNKLNHFFNIRIQDMNADGKDDVLVTTNEPDGTGGVYVYEIPPAGEWKTTPWTRHTIATGFYPPGLIPGKGGPGTAIPFFVNVPAPATVKPSIIVSGDDNGTVDCLTPNSNDPHDWTYSQSRLATGSGTVGEVVADDLNGDGYTDFVVPFYKDNKVGIYTFAPARQDQDPNYPQGSGKIL